MSICHEQLIGAFFDWLPTSRQDNTLWLITQMLLT